ncbi:hypothetical protein FAUST_6712 [Fusarium austroamericanum]|uniref:Uncharacterized protein n=1 Tax=Fusarium austroamericanum TaxID=282268 RepID=A0AAN6BZ35_FUSAU|nr:hypothetical protein FAUST_6712 [Fusarium austroamericanum]
MISHNFFTGTVVLLAACLANASPCRPSSIISSSTVVASVSETATKIETATSTASVGVPQTTTDPAKSESTTETGTTVNVETTSSASSAETTTTALVDITTTTNPITSAETTTEATTTTATATTTGEEPEALQSISLYARGSGDPSLASLEGTGFSVISDTSSSDIKYIAFTDDVSSTLFFTLSERTGKVKIGNGPRAGNLLGYYPSNDYSLALAAEATLIEDSGLSPIDCDIVAGNGDGYYKLQCQFGNKGNADFWTCGSNFVLVSPGVDFTSRCPRATTSYKLDYIEVVYI